MSIFKEAFFFPLKKSSLQMFFGLTILFILQYVVVWIPVVGLMTFVFLGYIYATQFQIIFATGNGYVDAPEFPDFSDLMNNVLLPLFKVAAVWLIGFGFYVVLVFETDELVSSVLHFALLCFGFCYVPLGLMIAAMDEFTKALNPAVIFSSIRTCGLAYFVLVSAFGGFVILSVYLDGAFIGSWIIGSLIKAYGILFTGRLIGAVYRDRISLLYEPEITED